MSAKRFRITGSVQGVFFRAETQAKAQELGLTGWVKNCEDGSVEIHAEGSEESLKKLEEWCFRGPTAAEVENVEIKDAKEINHKSFETAY